ncbi:MAG: hypothetical protein Fur0041_10410 [Bacteroidia bacterium]
MLEFSKHILRSVSFDSTLFRKEFMKLLMRLKPDEAMLLKAWALATFGHLYKDIILEVYGSVMKS